MFKYINNVLAPFDCFCKLNIKNSYFTLRLNQLVFSLSDIKQKSEVIRSIPLAYIALASAGSFMAYRYLKKSIAKFKTREGDLASSVVLLQGSKLYTFLELALRHELYKYNLTLYRYRTNVNTENSLTLSFPDTKYLLHFRKSILHILEYTLGFDASLAVMAPKNATNINEIKTIFLSHFTILR